MLCCRPAPVAARVNEEIMAELPEELQAEVCFCAHCASGI